VTDEFRILLKLISPVFVNRFNLAPRGQGDEEGLDGDIY
jgi:hypothetical protein